MKAKHHYILLVLCFVLAILGLSFLLFQKHKWPILLIELGLICLLFYSIFVYQKIIQPIQTLQRAIDALHDEEYSLQFIKTGTKDVDKLVDVYNSMVNHLRKERTISQEQNYFLDKLLEALPLSMFILDYDDNISRYNQHAQDYFSLKESLLGKKLKESNHSLLSMIDYSTLSTGIYKLHASQYRVSVNTFMHKGFARKFIVIQDITTEINQSQKQAYGKVIRMMAHEVNNSIGAINSILQSLLQSNTVQEKEIREYLPIVIERNQSMNQFMMNFAQIVKLPLPHKEHTDINQLLLRTLRLFQYQNDKHITWVNEISTEPIIVQADSSQIEQSIINIIQNSLEAIETSGNIRLVSFNHCVQIIDSGEGIKEEDKPFLFTPFYSTKPTGQGVGLMLVREILNNHQFKFELANTPQGTTFTIWFT